MKTSKRMENVFESATLKLNAIVTALKAQGKEVYNLTAGEPDFGVSDAAKQAVIESLEKNRSKYTPTAGVPELRTLVAKKTNAVQPRIAKPWVSANVIVTNGGKQALFDSILAFINPGDEVLIPSPFWLSYPEMVKVAEGKPVLIETTFEENYKLTPAKLKNAITAKTKCLILNSPSNPTGANYSKEEFVKLAEVLKSYPDVIVISDEIYERIIFEGSEFCSFLEAAPSFQDRTITVNGMSKGYAMTGWRIGWVVANERFVQTLNTLQGQSTSGINSLAQWASIAALNESEAHFQPFLKIYSSRRKLVLENLKKSDKIKVFPPEGAFYVFVEVSKALKPGEGIDSFCEDLLEKAQVAVVSGAPFGAKTSVRISFATDEKTITEGTRRIVDFCNQRL